MTYLDMEIGKTAKLTGVPILNNVLDTRQPVDSVIVCSDGRLGVHRLVLAAVSPFVGLLFEDQKLGEVAVILLPDVTKKTMEILLHLAYTGQMFFPKEDEEEVFAAMDMLLFGQMADLNLSKVWVKVPKPEVVTPPTVPSGTSGTSGMGSKPSKTDKRKREGGIMKDNNKRHFKKCKLDEQGKQVPVAYRTGVPIGKEGVFRLQKKAEKKCVRDGVGICPPPMLKSDPARNSVSLSVRKLPFLSIRIQPIEDFVCIEVPKKQKSRWASPLPSSSLTTKPVIDNDGDSKDDKEDELSSSPPRSPPCPNLEEVMEEDVEEEKETIDVTNKVISSSEQSYSSHDSNSNQSDEDQLDENHEMMTDDQKITNNNNNIEDSESGIADIESSPEPPEEEMGYGGGSLGDEEDDDSHHME